MSDYIIASGIVQAISEVSTKINDVNYQIGEAKYALERMTHTVVALEGLTDKIEDHALQVIIQNGVDVIAEELGMCILALDGAKINLKGSA